MTNSNFWDEFFLLKPKTSVLEQELSKLRGDQLVALKPIIRSLFTHCVSILGDTATKSYHIKICNAFEVCDRLIVMSLYPFPFNVGLSSWILHLDNDSAGRWSCEVDQNRVWL